MTDNSKQKVDNKIAGYVMNCDVVCVCCLSFRNRSDLCSVPSNVRTSDSFLSIRDAFRGRRLPVHLYPARGT